MVTIFKQNRSASTYLKSLKFRMLLAIIGLSSISMTFVSSGILKEYKDRSVSVLGSDVQSQCKILSDQLVTYGYLKDKTSEVINGELSQLANFYDGRIIVIDENFKIIKDTYGMEENKIIVAPEIIKCFKGKTTNQLIDNSYIEIIVPIQDNATKTVMGAMLVSVSIDSILRSYEILLTQSRVLLLAAGILLIAFAILVSQRLTAPLEELYFSLRQISQGHTNEDLQVNKYTEAKHISEEFNTIISQMRVLDESRQEFVSNVSHELKTPLTSMKVLADSLLMQENLPVELYQEFMQDIANEIERENRIINDLLALVKMDKKAANLNIEVTDINDLMELILKRLRPIAGKKNIEVVYESFRAVVAEVDETKLTLALSNLVENAIKYNHENGWVKVSLDADHKFFYIKVMDSGIGIPDESRDYIFERFYRVDKSHSNEIDGTGLGLAITKSAITVHRGTIKVSSRVGEGTVFSVRIPLNYIG